MFRQVELSPGPDHPGSPRVPPNLPPNRLNRARFLSTSALPSAPPPGPTRPCSTLIPAAFPSTPADGEKTWSRSLDHGPGSLTSTHSLLRPALERRRHLQPAQALSHLSNLRHPTPRRQRARARIVKHVQTAHSVADRPRVLVGPSVVVCGQWLNLLQLRAATTTSPSCGSCGRRLQIALHCAAPIDDGPSPSPSDRGIASSTRCRVRSRGCKYSCIIIIIQESRASQRQRESKS